MLQTRPSKFLRGSIISCDQKTWWSSLKTTNNERDFFRLCPPKRYAPPVTEYESLHSKTPYINTKRTSEWGCKYYAPNKKLGAQMENIKGNFCLKMKRKDFTMVLCISDFVITWQNIWNFLARMYWLAFIIVSVMQIKNAPNSWNHLSERTEDLIDDPRHLRIFIVFNLANFLQNCFTSTYTIMRRPTRTL